MPTGQTEQFADNWSYLKVELQWLDRLLMMAIAKHRQETKEIDRFAQSRADRVTSHWWKGIVSLGGEMSFDDVRKVARSPNAPKQNPQQWLDQRIQVSQSQGVVLGLPSLCDRLNLTPFEKNLVLLSLAPEVNRRYARLYRYLQGDDHLKSDLPTVDLVLRLLCRNDREWQTARACLAANSPLLHYNLLMLLPQTSEPFLNYPLKLSDTLVDYLLAEQPSPQTLDTLLIQPAANPPIAELKGQPGRLASRSVSVQWSDLVLPKTVLAPLQHLVHRVQVQPSGDEPSGSVNQPLSPGGLVLLTGAPGTGKTMMSEAIATSLETCLHEIDLALVPPLAYQTQLQAIALQAPTVLVIQSAHLALGRSSPLGQSDLHQFLQQRRQPSSITIFCTTFRQSVALRWQRRLDQVLELPFPTARDRLTLWNRAFPDDLPRDQTINWENLARRYKVSGGEIQAIAQDALLIMMQAGDATLSAQHIKQALQYRRRAVYS